VCLSFDAFAIIYARIDLTQFFAGSRPGGLREERIIEVRSASERFGSWVGGTEPPGAWASGPPSLGFGAPRVGRVVGTDCYRCYKPHFTEGICIFQTATKVLQGCYRGLQMGGEFSEGEF